MERRLLRLTEEVGGLARAINHLHGDQVKKRQRNARGCRRGIGDILFVLIAITNSMNIDLEESFQNTLEKYDVRDAERFEPIFDIDK